MTYFISFIKTQCIIIYIIKLSDLSEILLKTWERTSCFWYKSLFTYSIWVCEMAQQSIFTSNVFTWNKI